MKSTKFICLIALLLFCIVTLTACDPAYADGDISATYGSDILYPGTIAEVDIIYPSIENAYPTFTWYDQKMEVLSGQNSISISGLSITGVTPGTATIRVCATLGGPFYGFHEELVYSVVLTITVEDRE